MSRENRRYSIIHAALWILGNVICAAILVIFRPQNTPYTSEYFFLSVGMILFIFINSLFFIATKIYVFEPISLVFVVYLFVFFVTPIINIISDTTDCMGYDVMDGCKKATAIFIVSYIFFLLGYYVLSRKYETLKFKKNYICVNKYEWKNSKIEKTALGLWIISFGFGCVELISKGMSISYFLTLGLNGSIEDLYANSAMGFLGNFRFSMITAWLYLFVCDKKSLKTKICGLLTLEYFILRGFRHSLFVLIFSPIVYSYVQKKKKPRLRVIVILLGTVIFVMGVIQFVRGDLRSGTEIDWSLFDTSIFFDAIKGNCDVYKTFYGMVSAVPDKLNYQLGMASIVSTIVMVIPRRFWPGKPVSPIITNLGMFCGELAAKSGYAMPNISEYYLDFGIWGCIIGLWIFGRILQKLKSLYENKGYDKHGLILYSVFWPALLQVILRGYSPSYIYLLLFYAFPVVFIKFMVRE